MAVEFDKFVQEMADAHEHFLFAVEGQDWHYVLSKIADEFFPDDTCGLRDFGTITPTDGGTPVVWARRAQLPIEVVVVRFGLTRADALGARIIRLRPFPPGPKEPTVGYYGEA